MEKEFNSISIPKLVLKLGVPSMLAQFFNIIYSIVDRIFIGNMPGDGSIALAAIGVCAPAITAISAFATMIGIGGASYMSLSLGRQDKTSAKRAINNAFLMTIVISIAVISVVLAFMKPMLYGLGCSDNMYPYAKVYMTIYILGTFASFCSIGMNQFILAQGYAGRGMVAVVIGALCNVFLDPLFIYVFKMGIAGAAAATVASQGLAMIFVLYTLRRREMPVRLGFGDFRIHTIGRILLIGIMPFFITLFDNMILILLNVQLRRWGGDMGDVYIACCAVVQSFMVIVNCPGTGITNGCGTLFGYHYGAGNFDKVMSIFKYVFLLCLFYMLILMAVAQTAVTPFVRLFLNDPGQIALAGRLISKYTLGLWGIAIQFAFVDGLTAMGEVRYALPLSLFRKVVYIAFVFILPLVTTLDNLFYVGTIADVVGSLFTVFVFFTFIKDRLKPSA